MVLNQIEHLDLTSAPITDKELALIPQYFPNLKTIDLSCCLNIRDDGIRSLAGLEKLENIIVCDGCLTITHKSFQYLAERRPNLEVTLKDHEEIDEKQEFQEELPMDQDLAIEDQYYAVEEFSMDSMLDIFSNNRDKIAVLAAGIFFGGWTFGIATAGLYTFATLYAQNELQIF